MADYDTLELGDVRLLSGDTLHDAKLVYKTYGKLNAQRNNAIVLPAAYGGRHTDNEQIIREGMALDPTRYFIVVPNMFGNGLSSSPSNTPLPPATPHPRSTGLAFPACRSTTTSCASIVW